VILAPDVSVGKGETPEEAGASGLVAATAANEVKRIVNLGDLGSMRSADAPPPGVFDMDGHAAGTPGFELNALYETGGAAAVALASLDGSYAVTLPPDPHLEVEGSFDPSVSSVAVQIPVGPMTQSVHVVLHPPLNLPGGVGAVFGPLVLVDASGRTVAVIDPDPNAASQSPQDLTVAMQNAPAGGQLVVRVTGNATAQSAVGAQSTSTSSSNVPFVLDVQNQSQSTADTSSAAPAQSGWLGTLAGSSSASAGQSSLSSDSVSTGNSASDVAPPGQAADVPLAGAPVNDSADSSGYYVRMATGPLVSRSSGPLGPVLAASGADLSPPVDRHERALLQEIPNLEPENELENTIDSVSRGRRALVQAEEDPARSDPADRYVTVVLGAGGFPMKVTSRSSRDRAGLAGLLASLPAPVELAPAGDTVPGSLAAAADRSVALPAEVSYSADRRKEPDYLKGICGLLLGLGLTAGPAFSDLISSVRRKTCRWLPHARTRGGI
jgi:hypothetical protein